MKHIHVITSRVQAKSAAQSQPARAQAVGKFGIGASLVSTATFLLAKAEITGAVSGLLGTEGGDDGS